jgi:hypothetical protein
VGGLAALAAAALFAAAPPPAHDGVPFATVERDDGAASGITGRTTKVIRDRTRYRRVWRRLHEGVRPRPARPRMDFTRYTLVAVTGGTGTGMGLTVTRVDRNRTGLIVHATETEAGPACIVAQVIVHPYHLIRVPRTSTAVSTTRERVTSDC